MIRRVSSALALAVFVLLCIGIVMLASTSSVRGEAVYSDAQHFLKRQLLWLVASGIAGWVVYRFDYHLLRRIAWPVCAFALILLVLVFVPGIGQEAGGSKRWLGIGPFSVQPSEFAKFAVVLGFSAWLCRIGRRVGTFRDGVLYPVIGMGVTAALIMCEPDYGTTFLIGCVAVVILFTAGVKIRYLAGLVTLGVGGFAAMVAQDEVRRGRVLAFLMPDKYPAVAYHLDQSKIAFIKGGAFGVGLGDSIQKHLYLPEAHTDFILAIIGEELGLIATGMVVLLFAAILFCGVTISLRARDAFGRLMAMGLTTSIVLQAAINVGVVTGCFPTKGLPLPFISYGGSSLVASVAMVAVLLNIAKHADEQGEDEHTRSIKNRRHDF